MNLYKRNNIWWVSFTLNKHQYRLSTKQKTRTSATEVANALYNRYKDVVINKKVSFKQIVDKYYTLSHFDGLSKSTQSNYKTTIEDTKSFFHNEDIFNVNKIYSYVEYLSSLKKLSSSTIRGKYIPTLSQIFNEVKKIGFINENPFKGLDLSTYKKDNGRMRYLSYDERIKIKLYYKQNNKNDLLDYIEFAIETGLRQGEQLNLEWDRVDFIKKEIYIIETKTNVNRTIPLTNLAYNILQKRKHLKKPFVLSKNTLNSRYVNLKKDLNLKNLTWHDLRHTFASWAIKGIHSWQDNTPMPVATLQKWLGHNDIKMTMRYAHLQVEDLHASIKNIN